MTGPEHYQEAEKLIGLADRITDAGGDEGCILAAAQVHATLALAAATGVTKERVLPLVDYKAWAAVAGEKEGGDE
jgi:hypothetical protein